MLTFWADIKESASLFDFSTGVGHVDIVREHFAKQKAGLGSLIQVAIARIHFLLHLLSQFINAHSLDFLQSL